MKVKIIGLFVLLIVVAACSDGTKTEDRKPAIYGIVKDTLGNPIADAEIVILFDIIDSDIELPENDIYIAPNPAHQYASFRFMMESEGNAKVSFYDPVLKKVRGELIDEVLAAGMHEFQFSLVDYENDNKLIRNGIYEIRIVRNGDLSSNKLFVLGYFPEDVSATTTTDSKGQFTVPYDYIQLFEASMRTAENGMEMGKIELTDEIEIFALKNDQTVAYYRLKVDKTKVEDIIVQGPKK